MLQNKLDVVHRRYCTWKENVSPKWQMLVCVYKHFFQKGGGKKNRSCQEKI